MAEIVREELFEKHVLPSGEETPRPLQSVLRMIGTDEMAADPAENLTAMPGSTADFQDVVAGTQIRTDELPDKRLGTVSELSIVFLLLRPGTGIRIPR